MAHFVGADHNELLLLLAAQVAYLRAGDEEGIRRGRVVFKGGGVKAVKQITQIKPH